MAQARAPMGMEKRAHLEAIGALDEVAARWQQVHGRAMTPADIDEMYDDFVPLLLQTLEAYATLIPGTLGVINGLRRQGVQIGGTTGYFEEAASVVAAAAARQGYTPDSNICATQVSAGRPAPWMIYRTMDKLNVYPPEAVVSVGDTVPDVESGLNAGVWTIAVAKTGNEVGLTETELADLKAEELETRLKRARARLAQAGAHYVVDGIWEVPAAIEAIHIRLAQGERP
jgi:phosphonoacetaldehyde hydrolase